MHNILKVYFLEYRYILSKEVNFFAALYNYTVFLYDNLLNYSFIDIDGNLDFGRVSYYYKKCC